MNDRVDDGTARALRDLGRRHAPLIEHDLVLDVGERNEEAETGDDALSRADGEVIVRRIDQHRDALDVRLLAEERGLRNEVLQGEAHGCLVGEQDQGGFPGFLYRQVWRGSLDDRGIERFSIRAPRPCFRIQGVEDADYDDADARRAGGYGSRSRFEELGEFAVVLCLVGGG